MESTCGPGWLRLLQVLLQVVRVKAKLRAFAFSPLPAVAGRPAQVMLALANNMLEASCPPL